MKPVVNTFVKVSLLLKNPSAVELIHLDNMIWVGKSIVRQEVLVHSPSISAVSNKRHDTLRILTMLQKEAEQRV